MAQHLAVQLIQYYLLEWVQINYKMIKQWKILNYNFMMPFLIFQDQI
jgi:hypothetical protein